MTALEVAQWIAAEIEKHGVVYQEDAAWRIAESFGKQFVVANDNGSQSIDGCVLREFRRMTESTVVWDRGEKLWRWRGDSDTPDRQQ